jgi:hypothetical protein
MKPSNRSMGHLFALLLMMTAIVSLATASNYGVFRDAGWNTAYAAQSTGIVTILASNQPPTIQDRILSTTSGGSNISTPQSVNPDTEYFWMVDLGDANGLKDLDQVYVYVYKSSYTKTTFDAQHALGFRWVRNGWSGTPACGTADGCWQELVGVGVWSATLNYLISADSSHPALTGGKTGQWIFAAKLPKTAVYTTATSWNFEADVIDQSAANALRSGVLATNLYISITAPGNLNFGTLDAGVINQTAAGMPVTTTYTGNALFTLTMWGSGDLVNEFGDTIPISNIYVGKTSSPLNNDGVVLTTSAKALYQNLPVASGSTLNMYWYITTPDPFPAGTYTFTYYDNVDFQSLAP